MKRHLFLASLTWLFAAASVTAADSMSTGVSLYNKHDYQSALTVFQKCVQANAGSATALYYEALCYSQLGYREQAKNKFNSILVQFPQSPEAHLASTYLERIDKNFVNPYRPAAVTIGATSSGSAPTTNTTSNAFATSNTETATPGRFDGNVEDSELSKMPDETTVPFTRALDGHIYVNAEVNGRPMRVIFDTGASTCVFGQNQLEAAGIKPVLEKQVVQMGGVGSQVVTASPMIVNLKLGKIERHMPILVQGHFGFAPLLGQTFYNGYRYEFENQTGLLKFVKKTSTAAAIPYDAIEVPFVVEGNNMVVKVEVNGQACQAYFDTGASVICFDLRTFLGMGLSIPPGASMTASQGIGGSAVGYSFNVDRMKVGSITKNNVPVVVLISGGPPRPLLGQPFYSDRRFVIDNDKHVIKFFH